MKLAYVAGPYRATTEWELEENIRRAEGCAIALWQMGYAVICPHLNTAHFGGLCDNDVWLKGDLEILSRCDLIVVVGKVSVGVQGEIDLAGELGIPLYFWPQWKTALLADVVVP
jgi:hypothetical protein